MGSQARRLARGDWRVLLGFCSFGRGKFAPMRRIPDWSALDATSRRRRREAARPLATALDPILNAFAQIDAIHPAISPGPLGGLPYAAKDLFQTSSHRRAAGSPKRSISALSEPVISSNASMQPAP